MGTIAQDFQIPNLQGDVTQKVDQAFQRIVTVIQTLQAKVGGLEIRVDQGGSGGTSGSGGSGEAPPAAEFTGELHGDVEGKTSETKVVGFQGMSISSTAPTTGQVLAFNGSIWAPTNPGSIGGGAVSSVFGRTGAVVATAGDYTAAQVTNAVSTAGSYADPPWITSIAWSKITGAPSGGSQSPWLTDIDGNGKRLYAAGNIGIGVPLAQMPLATPAASGARSFLTIKGSTDFACIEMATGSADSDGSQIGNVTFIDPLNSQVEKRVAFLAVSRSGTTANNRGSVMTFGTRPDGASAPSAGSGYLERMRIDSAGNVGIGTTTPTYALDVYRSNTAAVLQLFSDWSNNPSYAYLTGSAYSGSASNASWGLIIDGSAVRGTKAAPSATKAGDIFLSLRAGGNTGSGGALQNALQVFASADWSPTSTPVHLVFSTTATGSTAGAERMRIDNAGKVGIGAASNGALLDLTTGVVTNQLYQQWTTSFTGAGRRNWGIKREFAQNGDWILCVSSADNGTPDTTVIYCAKEGKVGIGITPAYPLDINYPGGDVQLRLNAWLGMSSDASGGAVFGQNIYRITDGSFKAMSNHGGGLGITGMLVTTDNFQWRSAGAINVTAGTTYATNLRMQLTATGLGIGSVTPACALDTGTTVAPIKVGTYVSGGSGYGIGVAASQLTFGAGINVSSGTPQMVLSTAGYLGVGTNTTPAPLTVFSTRYGDPSLSADTNTNVILRCGSGVAFIYGGYNGTPNWNAWVQNTDRVGNFFGMCLNPLGGNVGIGLNAPSERLHVATATGDCFVRIESLTTAVAGALLKLRRNTTGASREYWFGIGLSGADDWGVYDQTAAAFRHVISAGGNHGFGGITAPGYRVDVSGDVNVTGAYRINGVAIGSGGVTVQNTYNSSQRAYNSTYQNTTGKPMFVTINCQPQVGGNLTAYADSSSNPSTIVGYVYNPGNVGGGLSISFWVLPSHYYKTVTGGTVSFHSWAEWY